ncbi:YchJ family metal-binding protein [Corynebacteriaceae bacterium 7-707]
MGDRSPEAGEPETAEALMRSRFDAFRRGDATWLLRTWHPSTRPEELDLSDNPRWRGLQVVDTVAGGPEDSTGVVEFRATYVPADQGAGPGSTSGTGVAEVMEERSRFVREDGRWFYLDGEVR